VKSLAPDAFPLFQDPYGFIRGNLDFLPQRAMNKLQHDSHHQTQGTGSTTPESALVTAANYIRTGIGAVCPGGSSRRERFLREVALLAGWAECSGLSLTFTALQPLVPVSSGAEHEVFYDASLHKAFKLTKPGGYGHSLEGEGETASPLEYLERQRLQNELFGDFLELVGVLTGDHMPQILVSQPWITVSEIDPTPSPEEIDRYFEELGFERAQGVEVPAYYHQESGVVVLDAHAQNILRDENGRLVPIDLVMGYPGEWVLQWLGLNETQKIVDPFSVSENEQAARPRIG
jgi:hypothetical protein